MIKQRWHNKYRVLGDSILQIRLLRFINHSVGTCRNNPPPFHLWRFHCSNFLTNLTNENL